MARKPDVRMAGLFACAILGVVGGVSSVLGLALGAAVVSGLAFAVYSLITVVAQRCESELPLAQRVLVTAAGALGYLLTASVLLHFLGVRLTTRSTALSAAALILVSLAVPVRASSNGWLRSQWGWGAAVALLAVVVGSVPSLADQWVGITTPDTEFSTLSFQGPLARGRAAVSGSTVVTVRYTTSHGSSNPGVVRAELDGSEVAPQSVDRSNGASILKYRVEMAENTCMHRLAVTAPASEPGIPQAQRGDEAVADDAARSRLLVTAELLSAGSQKSCPTPIEP